MTNKVQEPGARLVVRGHITLYYVCSVHKGMFSTSEDHDAYEDIMIHAGDIMSTSGDVQYIEVVNVNQRLLSICSLT